MLVWIYFRVFNLLSYCKYLIHQNSSGVSHSDGSCVLGRIYSDVSSNISKKVYHTVTDNFVNLLHISYAWLYKTECWGSFMPLVLIHTGIVKYLWQILISYSIQFAYPTYSGSPFSDEIAIMIRHYVIHPYLKIRQLCDTPDELLLHNLDFSPFKSINKCSCILGNCQNPIQQRNPGANDQKGFRSRRKNSI